MKSNEIPNEEVSRRDFLRRVGSTGAMTVGVIGAAAWLHDRSGRAESDTDLPAMPSFAVTWPDDAPKMVIARGKDPAANLRAALEKFGGIGKLVRKGERVIIKPNVGWDRAPEQAANTNPETIGALVRLCVDAGASEVLVTDVSCNDSRRCFQRSGILDATRKNGGTVSMPRSIDFRRMQVPGTVLGEWEVLDTFLTADRVFNVAIVKDHSLSGVTLGMKNWLGVLGGRRSRLHQKIHESVVDLQQMMSPTLTILDAHRVLLRNGPQGGNLSDVREEYVLAVGRDPVALDAWGAELLDRDRKKLDFLQVAARRGLGVVDYKSLNPIEVEG